MSTLDPPAYAEQYLGNVCRMLLDHVGVTDRGDLFRIPYWSLVEVVHGEYLSDPTPADDCYRFTVKLLDDLEQDHKWGVTDDGLSHDMLLPCPIWTNLYGMAATAEGWDVFNCYGSANAQWQLQAIDEPEDGGERVFAADTDAWMHVCRQAAAGEDKARKALEFLRFRAPDEYKAIRAFYRDNRKKVVGG